MSKDFWSKHGSWVLGSGCALLQLLWFYVQLRVWKEEGHDHMLTVANIVMTCLLWSLLASSIIDQRRKRRGAIPILTIESATYGAIEGGGVDYPVEDFLNQIAGPSGLAFEIRNSKFKVNGLDYVPDDPKDNKKKRLKVTYSYDGGPPRTIRRREGGWLILPEDPYIEGYPLLRLDVIDAWSKLERFFNDQKKRLLDEQVSDAGRAGALLYSATPDADPYLAVEYERSLKSEMVDLYQRLKIYGVRGYQLQQPVRSLEKPVYSANCRDEIEKMMEILWQIAPKITEEDDESTRVLGRPGSTKKIR
jgi:hypothetical protein